MPTKRARLIAGQSLVGASLPGSAHRPWQPASATLSRATQEPTVLGAELLESENVRAQTARVTLALASERDRRDTQRTRTLGHSEATMEAQVDGGDTLRDNEPALVDRIGADVAMIEAWPSCATALCHTPTMTSPPRSSK